jgi:hypothetical protein
MTARDFADSYGDWLDDDWGDDGEACTHCDGEGLEECQAFDLCGYSHPTDGFHLCPACCGSGNRADQRIF